jgi:hypothetical protein
MSDGLCTQPNVFQQLMLQWERFAPYNAGQFFTLATPIDHEDLSRAFRQTVISLGLQQIGQHPDATILESSEPLDVFITSRMNEPFAPGDSPLRAFAVRENNRVHIGIIYRHVVADSASIRLVMRRWYELLHNPPAQKPAFTPVGTMRDRLGGVWREHALGIVREISTEVIRLSRTKQVRRLRKNDPQQPLVWKRIDLGSQLIGQLVRYAKEQKVKVNDLFVAAAAEACNLHLPHEESDARRDLAVGTIVDTRPAGEDIHTRFGLSLGVLQTTWRWQQLQNWKTTLSTAAAASESARRQNTGRASELRIAAAVWMGRRRANDELATFYRKRCPLAAGISNVNLNRDWPAAHHPSPLVSYTRVSPLGPMLPLVFTPTTLGETLNLGFTYRTKVVPDEIASRVLDSFIQRLQSL